MNTPMGKVRQFYEVKIASNQDRFEAFAGDQPLGKLRNPAERAKVPAAVLEASDFYYANVLEQDWGNVRVFHIPVEGTLTFAVRVVSDGGDGWLEVFDERGELLGAARTDCGLVLWRRREEIGRRVTEGLPLEPEFLAARGRRAQGQ
jgi:hypothetical protein